MPHEVSIVIVSYNVSELLRNCLNSIVEQSVAAEIIVVDNCSSDKSVQMVREEFSLVHLITNQKNVGFSAANNQGLEVSTAPYILLLNPDTEISIGGLRKLLDFAKTQTENTLIGPKLLNTDGTLQKSAWKKPSPFSMIKEALFVNVILGNGEYAEWKYKAQFEPGMISGAAMLFPRALFKQVGGLDPKLFWMEDADFCTRVRMQGGKVVYYPEVEITHHSGGSSKKNLTLVISNQLISKLKYYVKHYGVLTMMFTSIFCFFHIVSRLFLFALLSPLGTSFRAKAKAYLGTIPRFLAYLFLNRQRVT
jgi:GT2 family glycosyltransferase